MGVIHMQMYGCMDDAGKKKAASPAASARQRGRRSKPSSEQRLAKKRRFSPDSLQLSSSTFRSVEGRPPRHPDSPLSTSSLSGEWIVPAELYICDIEEYKNEKFPAETLSILEKRNGDERSAAVGVVVGERGDESEDTASSNGTFSLSVDTSDGKSAGAKESEARGNVSICDFLSPILNLLRPRRRETPFRRREGARMLSFGLPMAMKGRGNSNAKV